MTPEGRTKLLIKRVLDKYNDVYYYMPVPGGYGKATLDYLGFVRGLGFAIEAKRERGRPTQRQKLTIQQIERSGARVFVINGIDGANELDNWLKAVTSLRRDQLEI